MTYGEAGTARSAIGSGLRFCGLEPVSHSIVYNLNVFGWVEGAGLIFSPLRIIIRDTDFMYF